MKKLIYLIIILMPLVANSQKDTVYYFGVNGKLNPTGTQDIMKKVDYKRGKKVKIKTYKNSESGWILVFTEKMKPKNDSVFDLRIKSDEYSGKLTRTYKALNDNKYRFTDKLNSIVKRTGITTQKAPLIFEGEVTENYSSGKIKSVAQYSNNELVSNKNWLAEGTLLVDDIFQSVDNEPLFAPGKSFLYQQIRQAIKDSKFDLLTVEGKMVVGLVITKEGKIGGVQIVKGISQTLNGILVDAFSKVEGSWEPARLNGKPVNYFLMVPINFIYSRYDFESLEMQSGMLYWVIN